MSTLRTALTVAERDALEHARWMRESINAAACTGRSIRRATMLRLVDKGLVTEVDAVKVDGDGFKLDPERYVSAFALTDKGQVLAKRIYEDGIRAAHQANGRHCGCAKFCAPEAQ